MEDSAIFDDVRARELVSELVLKNKTWAGMPVRERVRHIRKLRRLIAVRSDEIAAVISEEKQKPVIECLALEVLVVLEISAYNERMFPRWLAPKTPIYNRPGFFQRRNTVYRDPIGTVCVISPANFPFSMGLASMIYLLLAGNTVALKPSELSVKVGPLIEELLDESGISKLAACVVHGGPDAGKWLIENERIRKVFFYGRHSSGKKVHDMCTSLGKPCVLETSGGTTAIVCKDADMELAARGIAWGACFAGGEACIRTNRIIVEKGTPGEFLALLKANMEESRKHSHQLPGWADDPVVRGCIEDATRQGAVLEKIGDDGKFPVLLTGVTSNMRVWNEEIGRPFAVIMEVENADYSLRAIEGSPEPLGVSIWTSDLNRAHKIARDLGIVMTWFNDNTIGLPCLPWGGSGSSGQGLLFSEFALHEATKVRWTSQEPKLFSRSKFWWYPYNKYKENLLRQAIKFLK